jgi:hypothetical protein
VQRPESVSGCCSLPRSPAQPSACSASPRSHHRSIRWSPWRGRSAVYVPAAS